MNRLYLNLALGLVALALAGLLYFDQEKTPAKPPLTRLAAAEVTTVLIEHPGQAAIRLEQRGEDWLLTQPVSVPANRFGVSGVLALLDSAVEATLEGQPKLADLGLEPAGYAVTYNDLRVEIGGVEPLKYRRYVRVGDQVHLIADPAAGALDADYSDLASRKLLPEGAELVAITLPGLSLSRDPAGAWRAAEQPEAGPEAINPLVTAWTSAESMWNGLAEAPTPDPASEEAVLRLADGSEQRFEIAAREPQLALINRAAGLRYAVSKAQGDSLLALTAPKPPELSPAEPPGPGADLQPAE